MSIDLNRKLEAIAALEASQSFPKQTIYFQILRYLVKQEKILGVPSYADAGRAITQGSIYHVIYYGKNSMGSYANQLNEEERWQVVAYVEKLKAELEK